MEEVNNRSGSKCKQSNQEDNKTKTKKNEVQVSGVSAKNSEVQPHIIEITNSDNQLNRKDILEKRKERKQAKQIENKRIREQKLLEEKIYKHSEKIQIITSKDHQKYKNLQAKPTQSTEKFKKYNTNINLLEFIIKRCKNKRPLKQINKFSSTTKKFNKGKRRENKIKKNYTQLKKIILKNRKIKEISKTVVDPIENILNFEELNLNDENPNPTKSFTIHSRKFRPYCDNLTSKNLCNLTEKILRELFRFQKRAYEKNEIKARAHRRFVIGFKETKNQLDANKLKFIVIAPDCEACDLSGGIDETISIIKSKCKDKNIPYMFSLRRRQLGFVMYKKVPVNCIGVISYDGAQNIFHELIQCLNLDRENYVKTINSQQEEKANTDIEE